MLGLLRDREPLLRRSYPHEPTYQGYPEGGAARDPVPKAASGRRCCSCSSELCLFVVVCVVLLLLLLLMLSRLSSPSALGGVRLEWG